jgi:hypothetical protein
MRMILVCVMLVGCGRSMTVGETLEVCKTICGDRPVDDFSVSGFNDNGFSCLCGKKPDPPPCDAGK